MAGESRHERPVRRGKVDDTGGDVEGGQKLYYHLTLLAETTEGYRNLLQAVVGGLPRGLLLQAPGRLGAARAAPRRADRHDRLPRRGRPPGPAGRGRAQGAGTGGPSAGHLRARQPLRRAAGPRARRAAADQSPTGRHRHDASGAPLLATNDSHYTHREDAVAHDALLCVQTGATIDDPKRFKFEGTEHYLKSAAEMRHLFAEVPEACDNTLLIAERANVEIEFGRPSLPEFPVPDDFTGDTYEERAMAYLRHLTYRAAPHERYGNPLPAEARARLDYELGVIGEMGFAAYFLVVWDLIRYARESGIRVGPGRGSAAGCCVAYCLRIVDLDPIRYDLFFERFLNPGRKQMPDIDMDFDERYRAEMIRYAAERYGSDHVAQIVTFSTIKARAAVRDAARVLGLPYIVGDKIAKAMPPLVMGRDTPLSACLEKQPEPRGRLRRRGRAAGHVRVGPRGQEGHRRRQGPRGPAPPGRHPRRRRRDHPRPADRVPPRPAQAGRRRQPRGRPHRHPVRDARGRGARPAQDGLPRAAQPLGHRAGPRPDRAADRAATRHRPHRSRRRGRLRHAPQGGLGRRVPAGGPAHAVPHALARPDQLRRRGRPGRPLPAGADGGQHAQRLRRPQERPQARRPTCTPTSRTSSATPRGS